MSAVSSSEIQETNRRPGLSRKTQDRLTIILFLLPALTFIIMFQVYPLTQSVYYSTLDWNGLTQTGTPVGMANFEKLIGLKAFWGSVRNSVLIMVLSLTIQLPLSLLLALLVGRDLPGRVFFRTLFFMPFVLSEVIIGAVWANMFKVDPHYGFLNAMMMSIGLPKQEWLSDPSAALTCVFAALTWQYFGLHMLLYIAGLQNIPRELEEAARIDGTNDLQTIWHITLPLLGNALRTSVYLSMLGSLQIFGVIWIMTKGGPINATETMATYMYRSAFLKFNLGYGSAVAVVMLVFSLVFSVIYQRLAGHRDYIGGY